MYKLRIAGKAKKEIKKISKLHQKAILLAFKDLREDPFIGKPLTRDLTKRFAYKLGVYRIIYTINKRDKIISILTAGHRAKVYG